MLVLLLGTRASDGYCRIPGASQTACRPRHDACLLLTVQTGRRQVVLSLSGAAPRRRLATERWPGRLRRRNRLVDHQPSTSALAPASGSQPLPHRAPNSLSQAFSPSHLATSLPSASSAPSAVLPPQSKTENPSLTFPNPVLELCTVARPAAMLAPPIPSAATRTTRTPSTAATTATETLCHAQHASPPIACFEFLRSYLGLRIRFGFRHADFGFSPP